MASPKLRRHIAIEAAKLMYERVESEYFTAKRKAAARLGVNFKHSPQDLPSNREIRDEIQALARLHEGDRRLDTLRDMRLASLRIMRMLAPFEPRLIGSVLTGHVRKGSDIDIHVFADGVSAITEILEVHNFDYRVERKRVIKHATERIFTHIHFEDENPFELTMYGRDQVNYTFKSSITGKAIERASISELEQIIKDQHPEADISEEANEQGAIDHKLIWSLLLTPLENVKQDPRYHPEGDALFHSLQAFELARQEFPYDQELITAALLHDVGKAIDMPDHAAAGVEALQGTLTPREEFLIAHHMDANAIVERSIGAKQRNLLQANEWYEDLMTLRDLDARARKPGAQVCTLDEALSYLSAFEEYDQ